MVSQEHSDVFVCVNEHDESRPPTGWRWHIKECKNTDLKDYKPEEYHVNELYHFLRLLN